MNRLMKIGMLLGIVAILGSTTAFAQNTPPPKRNPEHRKKEFADRFEEVSQKLKLTEEQQTKIKELLAGNRDQIRTIRDDNNKYVTKDQKRTAMITQLKKLDSQIIAVLNTEQQTTYTQLKEERKKELRKKRAQKAKEQEEMEDYQSIF